MNGPAAAGGPAATATATLAAPHRGAEHEFEPAWGLPEPLPRGERLLWQGQPADGEVARRVFRLPLLAAYFGVLLAWRALELWREGLPLAEAARTLGLLALLAASALGVVALLARWTARTTVYTLTDRRVVMRIGIVLTVTYNLPLTQIDAAHRVRRSGPGGAGDIALELRPGVRIAYLHLWPHARPWRLAQPQPMLRALPDADAVAALLTQAWSAANDTPAVPAGAGPRAGAGPLTGAAPALGLGGHAA